MQVLREHAMLPSMSRPGNLYDNATCESFIKTLKREEIYANTYRDFEHLSQCVELFIEQYYNRCRLHSALNYRSPEEFEREPNKPGPEASLQTAMVRFFGRQERHFQFRGHSGRTAGALRIPTNSVMSHFVSIRGSVIRMCIRSDFARAVLTRTARFLSRSPRDRERLPREHVLP